MIDTCRGREAVFRRALVLVLAVLVSGGSWASEGDDDRKIAEPTHKQVRAFQPLHAGKPIHLNTFCLDREGNIIAAVGGFSPYQIQADEAVEGEQPESGSAPAGFIQIYSPDWELRKEMPLDFQPTAVNFDSDGNLYVGGESVLCKFSPAGELLKRSLAPNLAGQTKEELEAEAKKSLEVQGKQMLEVYSQQLKQIDAALEARSKSEEKPSAEEGQSNSAESTEENQSASDDEDEEDADDDEDADEDDEDQEDEDAEDEELNPFLQMDTAQLKEMQKSMRESLEVVKEQFNPSPERIAEMIKQMGNVNSLAVAKDELFVTTSASQGFGYEIWRTNRDFEEPKRVKSRLSGCCGQLDIQSDGENLLIAENTKFRVGVYTRDGKSLRLFGSQDRAGDTGFGSCCNPMNIRVCSNGDVLTAESSIGTIKRFDANGKLLGNIGKAKISGGCKHVALAHDEQRDRYYMQYEDASTICVLIPKSEITGETPEEVAAREARDGLGKKLAGKWVRDGKADPNLGYYQFSELGFASDGKLNAKSSGPVSLFESGTYEFLSQKENQLRISVLNDNVEMFQWTIEFTDEAQRTIRVGLSYGQNEPNWLGTYTRQAD